MRFLRTLPLCLLFLVTLVSTPSFAQSPAPAVRIVEKIDDNQLVTLKGNTLPVANAENDLGPVSSNLPMANLVLVLTRSPERQAAFDDFVASQYDSSSPNYHHWLQPAEVGERFGPSLTDIVTLSNWLAGRGFAVAGVSKDRMTIRFSGTAAQVQAAFHIEIHNLSVRGEKHIANMSDPQIPLALAPVVTGVKGLHDFRPKPLHRMGSTVTFNSQTGKWQRNSDSKLLTLFTSLTPGPGAPHPDFGITTGSGSSAVLEEDVAPYDFATIYNVLPLWNASTPINGTGQTIAVVGTSDIDLTDVSTFRTAFGLPAGLAPVEVKGANGLDPGICTGTTSNCTIDDLTENTLDVEWSGAVATGAQVVLVTSGQLSNTDDTVYDSANYIIENVGVSGSPVANAHILNVSYGLCELGEGTSGNAAYSNLWQTATTEGIAVFVAAGDAGSAACDQGLDTSVPYTAQYGLSVSGIASTPYNTAVGGTDLNWGSTASPYWNATNSSTTGASAAGYMPEVPWNDTCTNPLTLSFLQTQVVPALQKQGFSPTSPTDAETACQFVLTWYQTVRTVFNVDLSSFVDVVGGGGGASSCTNSDGQTAASCTGGYAKPSWQANVAGIPADGVRDLPDVSFFASNGFLGSAYLVCVSAAGSCTYSSTTENTAQEVGGTSVASPAMAGVMALINQKAGEPQGSPNAELYELASKQNYANCKTESGKTTNGCYFNDIDTGTIAMPCQPQTANCTAAHTGDSVAVLPGFAAAAGYDQATGLGSLNVANVVNGWTSILGSTAATITVTPSANSIAVNQPLTVTVTVNGSNSVTPTGTVTLNAPGYLGGIQTLSAGSNTFSIPAFSLTGGTDTLSVSYSGDNNYAQLTNSTSVTVSKATPGSITVSPNATSLAASTALTVTGVVGGVAGGPAPTGMVTLSGGGLTAPLPIATLTSGAYTITIPANSLSVGSDTLTATYSGDGNYLAGTPGTATVTVTSTAGATPAFTITANPSTIAFNATVTVSGSVVRQGGGSPAPTGTVTLKTLSTISGSAYTSPVTSLGTNGYSITVPANTLITGTDALTVNYSGDTNYSAGGVTAVVTVTKLTPTGLSVTPSATSIAVNTALTVTGSVAFPAGSPAPTGSVTLSGGGYKSSAAALTNGNYSITIPADYLSPGSDSLTVTYSGDNNYSSGATGTATVTVTKLTPTVAVTPAATSVDSGQTLNVTGSIAGPSGGPTPTGTVTLSSGSYTSAPTTLSSGGYSITIPANSLAAGTDTLTAAYSGDSFYTKGSNTASVTVAASTYALSASATTAVAPGASATSTISVASTTNYSSTVTLTCALNPGGPTNQSGDAPTCSIPSTAVAVGGTATATVTTVAATTGALVRPDFRRNRTALAGLGLAALAFLALLGIPAQRRAFRALLGMFILLFTLGSLAACGGGGGSSSGGGGGGNSNPGTAAGAYTFTVTGTGGDPAKTTATTTFTVTVN